MSTKLHIERYCHIKNSTVSLNGAPLFEIASEDFLTFIKAAYKELDTKYSKFFKMDNLSKLAFLAADVLLKEDTSLSEGEKNIAIVLSNRASSLDTDRKHQASISDPKNYYPSPAVFVYTLPNICIGEISIKHKLFSENSFFIFETFSADLLKVYTESLLKTNKAEKVLCGWVDFDADSYEAFLYLVSSEGTIEHNNNEITRLYRL
ncbi:3-oxoacyl-ACP synthase [Ulvibacter litoralis]|uniref:3-oxoacyl-ACP synthase n=1 Tax=Ulvibacter litoralis TaxID=227084 RepID=A0A1G7DT47_9FLAO|nr:3-oxoacyl-ACP synthase [Ulvibacter litoralis]GHC42403.1 hypothetical protein GCM10008083_00600 [Ulvibacter litoralis]SDE54674.1 hypothetical protein SAMN05421855_1011153 [Ulvibacter litoralis]